MLNIKQTNNDSFCENKNLFSESFLWGIDLGGTKIEGVILDASQPGKALHRLRVPTESARGADHIIQQMQRLVMQLEEVSQCPRPSKIGIGVPGVIDLSTGIFSDSNISCLVGRQLEKELSAALKTQTVLANDANCFALAESLLGAARGYRVVLGIIIGTGVGGGIVIDQHLLPGRHGIAGEWGNNMLYDEEITCDERKKESNETVFSGPALERFYEGLTKEKLTLPEIVRRAFTGEAPAVRTLQRLQDKFAEAIAVAINILDPDIIVIGGGVGNIDLLYEESTRRKIESHLFHHHLTTEFRKPILGDSAGVFGAAML